MATHQIRDLPEARAGNVGVISTFTNISQVDLRLGDVQTYPYHRMYISGDSKWNRSDGTLKPGGRVLMSVTGIRDSDPQIYGWVKVGVLDTDDRPSDIVWVCDRNCTPPPWTSSSYDVVAAGRLTVTGRDVMERTVLAELHDGYRWQVTSTEHDRCAPWAYYDWELSATA